MRLNLGCGEFYAHGWTNVDLPSCPHRKDVEADIRSLPFRDGSAERVYCGHVLEHLTLEDAATALREVRRVLSDDGVLLVVGPAFERAADDATRESIRTGGCRWEGDEHRWVATVASTLDLVAEVFPLRILVSLDDLDVGWPIVSRIGWQCAVLCG